MARPKSETSMTAKVDLRLTEEQQQKLSWLSKQFADGNASELLRSLIEVQFDNAQDDLMSEPLANPWLARFSA